MISCQNAANLVLHPLPQMTEGTISIVHLTERISELLFSLNFNKLTLSIKQQYAILTKLIQLITKL